MVAQTSLFVSQPRIGSKAIRWCGRFIDVVPNEALLTWEAAGLVEEGAGFLRKEADVSLK